jgi:glycerophosphoryl diester phosphodiesterase
LATSALPSIWPDRHRGRADVLRIAHRGGTSGPAPYGPENLERIARLGAHLLEFDVRTTADDELVVAHDPVVVDRLGTEVRIEETLLADLQLALGDRSEELDARRVVARTGAAGLGLYVDVKTLTPGSARRLAHVIEDEGMAGRSILASVDPDTVRLLGEAAPDAPRSILFVSPQVDALDLARSVEAHFVHPCWEHLPQPHQRLGDAKWRETLRDEGRGIVTWHVEDHEVAVGLFALGVDGVCTDVPELLASIAGASTGP